VKSTDWLKAEHDVIQRALHLLEQVVGRIDSKTAVPDDFPRWVIEFFREFADRCHHAKEEDLLFPLLKDRGMPQEGGPIGVMLHEHDLGRECIRRMRGATEAAPFDGRAFVGAAKEYIALLRQHIDKENNVLFPMAGDCMSAADDAELTQKFAEAERAKGLEAFRQRFESETAQWEQSLL
jgi:hemerythrin-like domain-containing protein